jgi:acyl-CoA synthetase (AMP-forming)/AMP-acid ligase II
MFFKKIPGIKDAIAFNNPKVHAVNKLLVFAVFEDEQKQHETIAAACELAVKQMGFLLVPSCIRAVKAVPRTPTGDPDRLACRKMVAKRAEVDLQEVE